MAEPLIGPNTNRNGIKKEKGNDLQHPTQVKQNQTSDVITKRKRIALNETKLCGGTMRQTFYRLSRRNKIDDDQGGRDKSHVLHFYRYQLCCPCQRRLPAMLTKNAAAIVADDHTIPIVVGDEKEWTPRVGRRRTGLPRRESSKGRDTLASERHTDTHEDGPEAYLKPRQPTSVQVQQKRRLIPLGPHPSSAVRALGTRSTPLGCSTRTRSRRVQWSDGLRC